MSEQKLKRNIAYKLRISDILIGKPIVDGDKFKFIELGNKNILRVNVVGNIIDKYESEGEKKFLFFTLDDGSGQIQIKLFGEEINKFKNVNQGETVIVIGILKYWNNEKYIAPEIIKETDPRYLLIRKFEVENDRLKSQSNDIKKEQIIEIKDRIIEMIKNSELDGGIETEKIILNIRDVSPSILNQEIQKLIEEGIIFEPRPGKIRYLG